MPSSSPLSGMRGFLVVWFGQVVSLLGTAMSAFALTIWAWQITGKAEALALVGFFSFAPAIIFGPIAGALVDRWNRKLVMAISDIAAGMATIAVFFLYNSGQLQIWHLYVTGAFTGAFQAFQWPAYSAAISTMLPKEQYARAFGLMSIAEAGSGILAPVLAGLLLTVIGLNGILTIDIVTFIFAVGMLMLVPIPQPAATAEGQAGKGSLWQESLYGFRYIFARPSLFGLQLVFFAGNLLGSLGFTVMTPMILARTASNATVLGSVQSAGAVGGVIGGLLLSAWGGPKRKIHGVLIGHVLIGVLGQALLGVGRALPVWAASSFASALVVVILNGSNQAIWQAKVPPDLQGRVFSVRRLIAQISAPVAMIAAGVLADRVFEPAMQEGGALYDSFRWLVGSGPGAGMALMLIASGLLAACVGVVPYAIPTIRNVETIMPDHESS
jgi:DHA3 family macrolide efflux protein-like MFS transporter